VRVLVLMILVGCGGAPAVRPPLPEGRGVYALRFNPPPCLSGRPDLQVEVQTPQGWERVALDAPVEGDDDLLAVLLDRFAQNPDALVQVDARFTSELVGWSGRHQSRVFRLISLDPEVPDEH
jgi:hypothetical protein